MLRKQQLREENEQIRHQIELAKNQLIELEKRNGKKQIPIPGAKQPVVLSSNAKSSQPNANQTSSKPSVAAENTAPIKQAKEKKPKKEKPVADKPATSATEEAPVDIGRIDLRVGKIIEIDRHPDADSLYVEKIDLGEAQPRTVVSGLVKHIPIEEMQNRLVVVMCNLKPAKMRGVTSEGMVMCASSPEKVEVMIPPLNSVPGDLVHCDGYTRNPDAQLNPKKKIWETVAPDLLTNEDFCACYKGVPLNIPNKGHIKATTLKGVNVR